MNNVMKRIIDKLYQFPPSHFFQDMAEQIEYIIVG